MISDTTRCQFNERGRRGGETQLQMILKKLNIDLLELLAGRRWSGHYIATGNISRAVLGTRGEEGDEEAHIHCQKNIYSQTLYINITMATTMVIAVKCLHPSRLHFLAIDILSPWKVQFQIAKGCYTLLHTQTHPSPYHNMSFM